LAIRHRYQRGAERGFVVVALLSAATVENQLGELQTSTKTEQQQKKRRERDHTVMRRHMNSEEWIKSKEKGRQHIRR